MYSSEQLNGLLQFVDKYRCSRTRCFIVDTILESRYRYHPAQLVGISCRFNIPDIFKWGFKSLLALPLRRIKKEHRLQMGPDAFIALAYAKSLLDEHVRVVACEEPPILKHADDCADETGCQEDWHGVWWNGMGRFLLDGRNPQPFTEAVDRFREFQFGRMSDGCRKLMFQVLEDEAAFHYADVFIADLCNGLVDELRLSADLAADL